MCVFRRLMNLCLLTAVKLRNFITRHFISQRRSLVSLFSIADSHGVTWTEQPAVMRGC
jgi:hypothetical protein